MLETRLLSLELVKTVLTWRSRLGCMLPSASEMAEPLLRVVSFDLTLEISLVLSGAITATTGMAVVGEALVSVAAVSLMLVGSTSACCFSCAADETAATLAASRLASLERRLS